jgi:CxxC motif-containing protein (DUF1111 family)
MGKKWMVMGALIAIILVALACEKVLTKAPADDEILDGPVEGLTGEQHQMFLRGDVAFNDDVFTSATGLGPLFVSTSCGSCHAGDGKGHPFTTLTRFGQTDSTGNHFLQMGGPQLQNRAIPSFMPEQIPLGATFSKFTPPANTGLGFLDAVPDNTILSMADPHDADGDGISGRINWITLPSYITHRPGTVEQNNRYIGRFGKKAAVYDLMQQTANAYNQDMGVVSSYEPYDSYTHEEIDPEVSNQKVLDLIFYLRTLKAPVQRNQNNADVINGKQLFINIGCAKCHTPELKTGTYSITAMANKTFHPYTDLLLHDMGSGLNDGYTEGSALTEEWRTPPLWGLGLSKNSQGGQYFLLHDGRATSIEQAITLHGGEAQASNTRFQQLSTADKSLLIKFLESL